MPDTGPHRVELDEWISFAPFERLLNMTIEEAEKARAVLSMPFFAELAQGQGLMHGGALVSLADTACSLALKSVISPRVRFATVEMQTRFLYPVTRGIVTARARVLRRADRRLETEATVYNEEERPVMSLAATFKAAKGTRPEDVDFPNSQYRR